MTSADLIAELQTARPTADTALRERVLELAASAPPRRPGPFERLPRLSLRRFALVAIPATAVVLIALAGGVGLLDPSSNPGVTSSRESLQLNPATTTSSGFRQAAPPQAKVGTAADAATPAPTTGRAQRYSAQLTLSVKDVDALSDATQQALRITRDLGGYVVNVSYATSDTGVSSLTLKVPTANVQEAIVRLTGLGHDRLAAGSDRRPAGPGRRADEAGDGAVGADREALRPDRRAGHRSRGEGDSRGPSGRGAGSNSSRCGHEGPGQRRGALRDDPAHASDADIRRVVPAAPTRWDDTVDRAGEILAIEAMVVLTLLVVLGPLALVAVRRLARPARVAAQAGRAATGRAVKPRGRRGARSPPARTRVREPCTRPCPPRRSRR